MLNFNNPLPFAIPDPIKLGLPDAQIEYWSSFIPADQAQQLYLKLLTDIPWHQHTVRVYGKSHQAPRLSYWVADPGMEYSYSNLRLCPNPWSPALTEIKNRLEGAVKFRFNSVLLNYYRNGQDSNGWHSDDEKELGQNPVIASLSLGAARDFQLRHKFRRELKHSIALEHGSLLLMKGASQHCWQHQIPKRAHAEGRINLTFRTILSTPQS